MFYYDKISLCERIELTKSKNSKECIVCHYSCFNLWFKFHNSVCNGCLDLTMLCLNLSDIDISTIKKVDNRFVIFDISKSDAIYLLENSVLDDLGIYRMHVKEINVKK